MTSSCICQEQCVDSTALQQLRQFYPVPECSLGRRLVFRVLCSYQHSGPSTSIPIPLTFHCPGDRCPTVDISKALSKMCFLSAPAEPFWLVAALSSMIRSFQDKSCFLSSLTRASANQIWRWSLRVTQPLMSQIIKDRKDGFAQAYYPRTIPPRNSSIVYVSRAINNAKEGNGKLPNPVE